VLAVVSTSVSGLAAVEELGNGGAGELLAAQAGDEQTELRGRWFTTRCWASPAALRVTATTTPVGWPRTRVEYYSNDLEDLPARDPAGAHPRRGGVMDTIFD